MKVETEAENEIESGTEIKGVKRMQLEIESEVERG